MENSLSINKMRRKLLISDKVISVLLFLVSFSWFFPLINYGIIMGDDIGLFTYYSNIEPNSFVADVLFGYQADLKYRPINNIIQYLCISLFGDNYQLYAIFNIILTSFTVVILYDTLKIISQNKYTSVILCMLFIFFPSLYYNVTQLFGTMEALCVLFLVISARYMIIYFKSGQVRYLWTSVIVGSLMFLTHERFIVFYLVYLFCIIVNRKSKLIQNLVVYAIPILLYLFVKMGILGLPFFQGTGGDTGGVDIGRIISFFVRGFAALLGINIGPEYLNGYTISDYSFTETCVTIMSAIILIAIVALHIANNIIRAKDPERRKNEILLFLLAGTAIAAALISGCVTIRLEMRWLTAPFVVTVLYLGYIVSQINRKSVVNILVFFVCAISTWNAFVYRSYIDTLYFMRAAKIAHSVYDATIGQYGESLANYSLIFCGNNELEWAVGNTGNTIFDVYLQENIQVSVVEDLDTAQFVASEVKNPKIMCLTDDLGFEEVFAHGREEILDISQENLHAVSPEIYQDTPSGKGLCFLMEDSFTLLGGFSDRLTEIQFPPNAGIYMHVNMPYAEGDGAQVNITVSKNTDILYFTSFEIMPLETQDIVIELENLSSFSGEIFLEVISSSGDQTADWVTFSHGVVLGKNLS